jgi:hypothetical protein
MFKKIVLLVGIMASVVIGDKEVRIHAENTSLIIQSLQYLMEQEQLMKCIVHRDVRRRPDSKCLVYYHVQRKYQAIVSVVSSIIVDVVVKDHFCNPLDEIFDIKNCKKVVRIDFRKRFHFEFHSKQEEILFKSVTSKFVNYLQMIKTEKEQHLVLDIDQAVSIKNPEILAQNHTDPQDISNIEDEEQTPNNYESLPKGDETNEVDTTKDSDMIGLYKRLNEMLAQSRATSVSPNNDLNQNPQFLEENLTTPHTRQINLDLKPKENAILNNDLENFERKVSKLEDSLRSIENGLRLVAEPKTDRSQKMNLL